MKDTEWREVRRRLAAQHGVITREELRGLGIDSRSEQARVSSGQLERIGWRTLRLAGTARTGEQALLSACLEAGPGSVGSHDSAAWLWGLGPEPPLHHITVPRATTARVPWARVHRPRTPVGQWSTKRGIPCTDPVRTLADLGAVVDPAHLDSAIDAALAARLVTVDALQAHLERFGRPGRAGAGPLRAALHRRGLVGAPNPSVLESRLLRLLHAGGIRPLATEVRMGPGGRYRVDVMVNPALLLEADGYAYHHSPEQKAEDERRRNRIRLAGRMLLVYTWRDVVHDGRRLLAEVRQALDQCAEPA